MSQQSETQRTYTVEEAAAVLGLSASIVRREVGRKRLGHRRVGLKKMVFDARHLDDYRERNTFEIESAQN